MEQTTYKEFIENIINTRGQWNLLEDYEMHHIIPKCLGGESDYIDNTGNGRFKKFSKNKNCIYLTYKEHYIAHKLLALENPNNGHLVLAWNMMHINTRGDNHFISEEEYSFLRSKLSKNISKINSGRKLTPEQKEKIGNSVKGHKNGMYGKKHKKESVEKIIRTKEKNGTLRISKPGYWKGKKQPEDMVENRANKNKKKIKNITTGEVFNSRNEANLSVGLPYNSSRISICIKRNIPCRGNVFVYLKDLESNDNTKF